MARRCVMARRWTIVSRDSANVDDVRRVAEVRDVTVKAKNSAKCQKCIFCRYPSYVEKAQAFVICCVPVRS